MQMLLLFGKIIKEITKFGKIIIDSSCVIKTVNIKIVGNTIHISYSINIYIKYLS